MSRKETQNELTETQAREELMKIFRRWGLPSLLEKELPTSEKVEIGEKVRIPYRIWLEPGSDSKPPRLQVRHYEQDIALYSKSEISENSYLSLYQNKSGEKNLYIPYFIIEVKKGVSTHDLITYSEKAERIKSIFPFLKYFLVASDPRSRKWDLHGWRFDEMHSLGSKVDPKDRKLKELRRKITDQFKIIGKDIKNFAKRGRHD